MRHTLRIVLCLLAVALAVCAGQTRPGSEPCPVEQTPGALDGREVIDNTGISAVIYFAAGMSTMCNVTYGIDTTCGAIGIMPVMAGGVRDHSVTQRVLTPNITSHCGITLT